MMIVNRNSENISTLPAIERRKIMKPILEKKRRDRINKSLTELKSLILSLTNKEESYGAKMEKADILEMTANYLKTLNLTLARLPKMQQQNHHHRSSTNSHMIGSMYNAGATLNFESSSPDHHAVVAYDAHDDSNPLLAYDTTYNRLEDEFVARGKLVTSPDYRSLYSSPSLCGDVDSGAASNYSTTSSVDDQSSTCHLNNNNNTHHLNYNNPNIAHGPGNQSLYPCREGRPNSFLKRKSSNRNCDLDDGPTPPPPKTQTSLHTTPLSPYSFNEDFHSSETRPLKIDESFQQQHRNYKFPNKKVRRHSTPLSPNRTPLKSLQSSMSDFRDNKAVTKDLEANAATTLLLLPFTSLNREVPTSSPPDISVNGTTLSKPSNQVEIKEDDSCVWRPW